MESPGASISAWRRLLRSRGDGLIDRYTLPEMAGIWSEENRLAKWLEVELAVVHALAGTGAVPSEAAQRIRGSARFDVEDVRAREEVTRHDTLSFVECVCSGLGEDSRYFHMGLTSSDIVDTALALQIREANGLIVSELEGLRKAVAARAREHADTLMIGRTHGIHAEPITFGLKLAVWYRELGRAMVRIEAASREVCVGKISGSVGTYSHLSPAVEDAALKALGLGTERPATQIVQRDRHAAYMASLALAAATLEKMSVEIRHLQRTEVGEASEPFGTGQKGSSSMPHKRNPITLERVSGLARLLRSYAMAAMENVALWHERDISQSSVERVIFPDSTILLHYMTRKMRDVMENLEVDTDRMRSNLDLTRGLIYSQRLMLSLMDAGWERTRAYEKSQQLAKSALAAAADFRDLAADDREVIEALGPKRIDEIFDPAFYVRYAGTILKETGII
jgi:adenylosuccinate lyase